MKRGAEGESLPDDASVFRLCRRTSDGKIAPEAFVLSSDDQRQAIPRLSVWEQSLTTPDEADPTRRLLLVALLSVVDVRRIRPDAAGAVNLDVQWEQAWTKDADGNRVESTAPGAGGHCGIAGLNQGDKAVRKGLRAELARHANTRGAKAR